MSNRLSDNIKPEVKNILQKYHRLGVLLEKLSVPAEQKKKIDLIWLKDNLPFLNKGHQHLEETINLINKLTIIKKNKKW